MEKKYYILEPATFALDGGAMFGIIPKPLWSKVHPADDLNRIDLALRIMLIQAKDHKGQARNILIDTGIGDYHGEKFDSRFKVSSNLSTELSPIEFLLSKLNLAAADITDVVISHLHFDHIGGLGKNVNGVHQPIFLNATLHLHEKHYDYAQSPTQRDLGSFHQAIFLPLIDNYAKKNQLIFYREESGPLVDGILKYRISMGHTPYLLHPYDEQFIYMADLIPTSNHIALPWVMGYDIAPGVTVVDKEKILPFIADRHLVAIYEHDPQIIGSRLTQKAPGEFDCHHLKHGETIFENHQTRLTELRF